MMNERQKREHRKRCARWRAGHKEQISEYARRRATDPRVRAMQKEAASRYRARHPERVRESCRKWKAKHPEIYAAINNRFHLKNPMYGLIWEHGHGADVHYREQIAKQKNKCAVCARAPKKRRLQQDHDHLTEQRRGALCADCNHGLGFFGDSIDRLQKAIAYLKAWELKAAA